MLHRRNILKSAPFLALAPTVPSFLKRGIASDAIASEKILVVIQLSGGNDGLNTVVPFKDDGYLANRRALRLKESDLIQIDPQVGLHASMRGMADLLDAGKLAIVQGVGYPEPSRSHDVSMAIWQTGHTDSEEHSGYGWLGRALDQMPTQTQSPGSMLVSDAGAPIALRSRKSKMGAMTSLDEFRINHSRPSISTEPISDSLADFMKRATLDAYATADQIQSIAKGSPGKRGSSLGRIDTRLASSLKTISDLIQANMGTRVYYAMQPGYDTHAIQLQTHRDLLSDLSRSLKAFLDDLAQSEHADRVMVLCFSEFGRQVEENASAGTDHGTAGPLFLAGNGVRSGLHGQAPNLQLLDQNAPQFTVDFRTVYATILKDWLGVESEGILGSESRGPQVDLIKRVS